jgi:hypothetical protein
MHRVREVLRLGFGGISKQIARRTGLAASTVRETIARFKSAGLDWPLPDASTTASWKRSCTRMPVRSRAIAAMPSRIGRASIASCGASTSVP